MYDLPRHSRTQALRVQNQLQLSLLFHCSRTMRQSVPLFAAAKKEIKRNYCHKMINHTVAQTDAAVERCIEINTGFRLITNFLVSLFHTLTHETEALIK